MNKAQLIFSIFLLSACATKGPQSESSRAPASLPAASVVRNINVCFAVKEDLKPFHEAAYRASFESEKPMLVYGYANDSKESDFGRVWTGKRWVQLSKSYSCSECEANFERLFSVGDAEIGKNLAVLMVDFRIDPTSGQISRVELRMGEPRWQVKNPMAGYSSIPFDQTSRVRMQCSTFARDLEIKFK